MNVLMIPISNNGFTFNKSWMKLVCYEWEVPESIGSLYWCVIWRLNLLQNPLLVNFSYMTEWSIWNVFFIFFRIFLFSRSPIQLLIFIVFFSTQLLFSLCFLHLNFYGPEAKKKKKSPALRQHLPNSLKVVMLGLIPHAWAVPKKKCWVNHLIYETICMYICKALY